jgi:hypothetical protein
MKRTSCIFAMVILGMIVAGGCVQQNSNFQPVPPTQQTVPPTVVSSGTIIPQTTVVTVPAPEYKTADLVLESGTKPANRFKMDYPSAWTYEKEHRSWPSRASPVKEVSGQDPIRYWKAVYNFSSPDSRSYAHVYFDEVTGTGDYFYSINTWAEGVIREKTLPYCLDGAGNPLDGNYCSDARKFFYPVLTSSDPVTIKGSFEARKLVFSSFDDENYGQYTLYLMHSGQMQGYNFTIPDHPEVAVKVYGPAWDYGTGGQAYAIDFHTPADQGNTTRDIFSHMITSFEITG